MNNTSTLDNLRKNLSAQAAQSKKDAVAASTAVSKRAEQLINTNFENWQKSTQNTVENGLNTLAKDIRLQVLKWTSGLILGLCLGAGLVVGFQLLVQEQPKIDLSTCQNWNNDQGQPIGVWCQVRE